MMKKSLILKSQRNSVFEEIRSAGLGPGAFRWTEVPSTNTENLLVSQLEHVPTEFFFKFDFHRDSHWTLYAPGEGRAEEPRYPGSWDGQLSHLRKWLENLARELDAPDLWSTILEERALVASATGELPNTTFAPEEQRRISLAVNELRVFLVATGQLSNEQVRFVSSRLKHLEDAATRLGRKDWITLAIGALTNIIVGIALAPDAARELLRMAGRLLGWVAPDVPTLSL
jgi:hypothetical protein